MRSFWSGTISFGLINIPVRLYAATQENDLQLHMLRKDDLCPISYAKVCRTSGEQVPYEEIVKGYEYRKGDYVVLSDEDFKRASPHKTQSIDVINFADEDEIDSKYFDKPYFLEPGKGASKAYVLLREALKRSGKVAVAKYVLRTREYVGVIKAEGNALILNQLRYKAELKSPKELNIPQTAELSDKEVDVAIKLIDELTEPFKPEDFKDTYRAELEKVIEEKAKGKKPRRSEVEEEPEPTSVPDLMAKLRESLERERKRERARSRREHARA